MTTIRLLACLLIGNSSAAPEEAPFDISSEIVGRWERAECLHPLPKSQEERIVSATFQPDRVVRWSVARGGEENSHGLSGHYEILRIPVVNRQFPVAQVIVTPTPASGTGKKRHILLDSVTIDFDSRIHAADFGRVLKGVDANNRDCLFVRATRAPSNGGDKQAPESSELQGRKGAPGLQESPAQIVRPEPDVADSDDPTVQLIKKLRASKAAWLNGESLDIRLNQDADPKTVIAEALRNSVFEITLTRSAALPDQGGGTKRYNVAQLDTELGQKFIVFRYVGDSCWWARFYPVGEPTPTQGRNAHE